MEKLLDFFEKNFMNILLPFGFFLFSIFIGLLVRRIIGKSLNKNIKTKNKDIIIKPIKDLILISFSILGIYIIPLILDLEKQTQEIINKSLSSLIIISTTWIIAVIVTHLIKAQNTKFNSAFPSSSIFNNIVKITILIFGGLLVFQNLGISITPILTALGVCGLAIALALQDTLSNLFAGLQIIISKNIKIGDYVRLDSDLDGFVHDINWRHTTIREFSNNYIIIPNNKLSSSIIKNYSSYHKAIFLYLPLSVSYDSDLDIVEKTTIDITTKLIDQYPNYAYKVEPKMRFYEFADSGINFKIIIKTRDIDSLYVFRHILIKKILSEYKKKGIEIPYPQHDIHIKKDIKDNL